MGCQMSDRRSLTPSSGPSSSQPPEYCCDLVPTSSLGAVRCCHILPKHWLMLGAPPPQPG